MAFIQPGDRESEQGFNQQGEQSRPARVLGRRGRRGRKWFSYDLPVQSAHSMALVATYYSDERRKRTFHILVDGERVAEQVVEQDGPPRFFDVEYALPAALVRDKKSVTVRFEGADEDGTAAIYSLRMIRADAER